MLPDNAISSQPVSSKLLPPGELKRGNLFDWAYGGAFIGDSTNRGTLWKITLEGTTVWGTPGDGAPIALLVVPEDVVFLSASFDNATRPGIAYQLGEDTFFYWYDTATAAFTTTHYPGASRPMVEFDDARPENAASADLILAYIRAGGLHMRQQRDRYTLEYFLLAAPPAPEKFARMGMNKVWRFQFVFSNSGVYGTNRAIV